MHLTALFPHLAGLRIDDVTVRDDCVSLMATTTRRATSCPLCHRRSCRVHNHYRCRVADLLIGSMPVTLFLHARRFRCVNPRCPGASSRSASRPLSLPVVGAHIRCALPSSVSLLPSAVRQERGSRPRSASQPPRMSCSGSFAPRHFPMLALRSVSTWTISPCAKGDPMRDSSWTSTPAARSVCYLIAPPRLLPHGSQYIRQFVLSAVTVAPLLWKA